MSVLETIAWLLLLLVAINCFNLVFLVVEFFEKRRKEKNSQKW